MLGLNSVTFDYRAAQLDSYNQGFDYFGPLSLVMWPGQTVAKGFAYFYVRLLKTNIPPTILCQASLQSLHALEHIAVTIRLYYSKYSASCHLMSVLLKSEVGSRLMYI